MININTVALLLRDDIVSVSCAFSANADTEYTFVCEKSLAQELQLGDAVVIKGNKAFFQICYVRQVAEECDIDTNADFTYGWVVNKVDTDSWAKNVEKTDKVVLELKKKQRQATRRQALEALGINNTVYITEQQDKK